MKNILKKVKARDYNAMDACLRTAGFMKDRREPRGGSRNYQAEFLEDTMFITLGRNSRKQEVYEMDVVRTKLI